MNRRRFLQLSAAGAAVLAAPLGACGVAGGPELVVGGGDGYPFFDPENQRFEVEPFGHRVVRVGPEGQPHGVIGSAGLAPDQLNAPTGLAFGPDDLLYVADRGNSRIQIYQRTGAHVGTIGSHGTGEGELNYPTAVAFDRAGRLHVCDTLNHRVARFAGDGSWLGSWGRLGAEPGELNLPRALAFAADGTLHVLDAGNARVQVFDPAGVVRASYGDWGTGPDSLLHPRSLAIGTDGTVYVGDAAAAVVQVFSERGRFLRSQRLVHQGVSLAPVHLAFSPAGRLHIAAVPAAQV